MSGFVGSQFTNSGIVGKPVLGTPASGVGTNITGLDTTELTAGVLPTDVTGGEGLEKVQAYFGLSAANSATGVATKSFTGVPAYHRHIYLFFSAISFNGSDHLHFRLGHGDVTYEDDNYQSSVTNATGTQVTSEVAWHVPWGNTGTHGFGMCTFTRHTDTIYHWQMDISAHTNVPTYGAGQVVLAAGPATAAQMKGSGSNNFDSGTAYAGWE
jgi:hypothetical protein